MTKKLILVLVLCLTLIIPAYAADYTLTGYQEFNVFDVQKEYFNGVTDISFDIGDKDQAITLIHFKVPQDHTVDFTLYYGFGNTVTGSATNVWNTSLWPLQSTTSTIVFDGQTKQYSYVDTNPEFDYYLSGYAVEGVTNQTGLIVYSAGYGGFDNDLAIFKPVSSLSSNLIYRVDMSCDYAFDADISYGSKSEVAATVSKSIFDVAGEWISFGIAAAGTAYEVSVALLYGLRFIWENRYMIIALYIGLTAAIAFNKTRDVFSAIRLFFRYQRSLYEFIVDMWKRLIDIIAAVRSIFKI